MLDIPVSSYDQPTGVVTKKFTGVYHVETPEGTVVCSISSKLRKHLIYPTADASSVPHQRVQQVKDIKLVDPVAIGDLVLFKPAEADKGVITDILPRKSSLSRPAAGPKPLEQVVVANLDQVVAVFAATRPKPRWNLLDRYIVSAESAELEPLVCITKMDTADEDEVADVVALYRSLGYRVILTSSTSGRGIDELREALTGKLSALVGKSGVGKTSLLNALQPDLGARVGAVSEGDFGKGMHTTTHMEMFALDVGGAVVDTPGVRIFGLWEVDGSDIALYFREMEPFVGSCRFGLDCTHDHEPGCAIRSAVEKGSISRRRYDSYLRMLKGESD
jgi:ribosome biogenesis GTPase